mgnify:CR=1 FL=1
MSRASITQIITAAVARAARRGASILATGFGRETLLQDFRLRDLNAISALTLWDGPPVD